MLLLLLTLMLRTSNHDVMRSDQKFANADELKEVGVNHFLLPVRLKTGNAQSSSPSFFCIRGFLCLFTTSKSDKKLMRSFKPGQ